ncbi:MAG: hypothetical protein IJ493_10245 [Clostridia bacterium]|nr:hypothetical protein [Clostridia bacterium]
MSQKARGITKAALAGAVFGSVIGMVAVPRDKKKAKQRAKTAGSAMRIVGVAMQDMADLMKK